MSAQLAAVAQAMVAPGEGVLAADESIGTMSKRLEAAGIPATEESRRRWRELIVTTPGLGTWISGVILCDETFRQATTDGTPIPDAARAAGIMPGIKVDTGALPLAGAPDETVTEGLDGLRGRLEEYAQMGAAFAKWRAVITIGVGAGARRPTRRCVAANAHALARYAALCQEAGIVPIVEPEVLMEGDHGIDRCAQVTTKTLRTVFAQLAEQHVALEGIVLKPNMVLSGRDCPEQAGVDEVADATLEVLRRTVPAAVPGIAFLSGGQDDELATRHLDAMNRRGPQPWQLTFSYGRGLVAPPLEIWDGTDATWLEAQAELAHRARCNAAARDGAYSEAVEAERAPLAAAG
jgi:fructose-bisphosphate aldolase, class I